MKMDTKEPAWITVEQMRRHLGISKTKAYEVATSGAVQTVKIGRSLRINKESFTHWLDSLSLPKADGGDDMR